MVLRSTVVIILSSLTTVLAGNILVVLPVTSKSHYGFVKPILNELVTRGHNVTALTPFIEDNAPGNYVQMPIPSRMEDCTKRVTKLGPEVMLKETPPTILAMLQHVCLLKKCVMEDLFTSPSFKRVKEMNLKFDAVIVEEFFQESVAMFAKYYEAPLILISTLPTATRARYRMGYPLHVSTIPHELLPHNLDGSFMSRLLNLYYILWDFFILKYYTLQSHTELAIKYFPEIPKDIIDVEAVFKNASLLLINSHSSLFPPSGTSNIIEVGGLHIKERQKLPEDLQSILDGATEGFVYVNFGTVLQCKQIPKDIISNLIKSFRKFNKLVLWKCEKEFVGEKSTNVVIRDWFPQQAILAHPNIKLFVSHGGLLGVQEAVYFGIPILGSPFFSDQFKNMAMIKYKGCGETFNLDEIRNGIFYKKMESMLNDEEMKKRVKILSKSVVKQTRRSLETAVYWIEYVIENGGAHFLKSPTNYLSWYQHEMVDVYIFIVLFVILIFTAFIIIMLKIKDSILHFQKNKFAPNKKNN